MKKIILLLLSGLLFAGCTPKSSTDVLASQSRTVTFCYDIPDQEEHCYALSSSEDKSVNEIMYEIDNQVDEFWFSEENIDGTPVVTQVNDRSANGEIGEAWKFKINNEDMEDNIDNHITAGGDTILLYLYRP